MKLKDQALASEPDRDKCKWERKDMSFSRSPIPISDKLRAKFKFQTKKKKKTSILLCSYSSSLRKQKIQVANGSYIPINGNKDILHVPKIFSLLVSWQSLKIVECPSIQIIVSSTILLQGRW